MKGIVFKEFLGMVESSFGGEMVENIIDESNLKSEGAYTSVGTYDHMEIVQLVSKLSSKVQAPFPDLVKTFGKHLAVVFSKGFPDFFKTPDAFAFLKSVDGIIHKEVRKLYPDAELPSFKYEQPSPDHLIMQYSSTRPFADLAEGLIEGVIKHFGESIEITITDTSDGKGNSRRFSLKRV